jgi:chemotaxis signal transduction protein
MQGRVRWHDVEDRISMNEHNREPEWDAQDAQPLVPVAVEPTVFFRGIQVAGMHLLLNRSVLCEIVERPAVARVPNTPAWLPGLINHRGAVLPVFDLVRAFDAGHSVKRNSSRRLLIIGSGEAAVAVITDELPMHIEFTASDQRDSGATLPAALAPYLIGRYQKDEVDWLMFDYIGFFEGLAEWTAAP